MRWIEDEAGFERTRRPLYSRPGATLALVLACAILLSAILGTAAPEKHLAVFSVAANYSVSLMQHDGRDYVGLLELLEPLGRVSAKADGERWRLRYNNVEGDFQEGKNRAKVQGRDADLGAKFLFHNGRGLVPVAALGSLLPRFLGGPVTVHEESGRLFVGGVGTHFTASLAAENPPRLVFHFSAPVNPTIATEAGSLRMTFAREPVVDVPGVCRGAEREYHHYHENHVPQPSIPRGHMFHLRRLVAATGCAVSVGTLDEPVCAPAYAGLHHRQVVR